MKGRSYLNSLDGSFFTNSFSHVYIERSADRYPLAQHILRKFPQAIRIEIDDYKDVFARSRQNFSIQKHSPKLILAVQKPPFVYAGAEVCHDFGNAHFYYTSSSLNCLYNCDYCFLQGMFPSGNIVLFVNVEDTFSEVRAMLKKHPVYLSISYESDLLAFEHIAPFASRWIEFAGTERNLVIELRTKSANYAAIRALRPTPNVILAWTVSPEIVIAQHEPSTPKLAARLRCIRQAIDDGWNVRICFDPVLHIENWQEHYKRCVEQTFSAVPADRVHDISIGVFRIPKDYLKKMRKHRTDSALLHYPFVTKDEVAGYPEATAKQLVGFVYESVRAYVSPAKIYT